MLARLQLQLADEVWVVCIRMQFSEPWVEDHYYGTVVVVVVSNVGLGWEVRLWRRD